MCSWPLDSTYVCWIRFAISIQISYYFQSARLTGYRKVCQIPPRRRWVCSFLLVFSPFCFIILKLYYQIKILALFYLPGQFTIALQFFFVSTNFFFLSLFYLMWYNYIFLKNVYSGLVYLLFFCSAFASFCFRCVSRKEHTAWFLVCFQSDLLYLLNVQNSSHMWLLSP